MSENTDKLKTGDIFVNPAGAHWIEGLFYSSFTIFEYRKNKRNGCGYRYFSEGKAYPYFTFHPGKDCQITDEKIISLFKKGLYFYLIEDPTRNLFLELNSMNDFQKILKKTYEFKSRKKWENKWRKKWREKYGVVIYDKI